MGSVRKVSSRSGITQAPLSQAARGVIVGTDGLRVRGPPKNGLSLSQGRQDCKG